MDQSAEVSSSESAKPLKRSAMEAQMSELRTLQKRFDTAAVKDSITYNFPINPLPKVASTIDEEIVEARRRATEKPKDDEKDVSVIDSDGRLRRAF